MELGSEEHSGKWIVHSICLCGGVKFFPWAVMSLLLYFLLPALAFASVGEFRWSTPYPDGRTQDLLAVVSPVEFFMAAKKISGGIHHYLNGVWSWIPPPPDVAEKALCIATRHSGTKVAVIVEGDTVTYNEYSMGAKSWGQTVLREFQVRESFAYCFMTNTALFIAANQTAVYDLGSSVRYRPSTNLCQSGCKFITGNNQAVYTFTGPPEDQHLLKYNFVDWEDVGKVNTTISPIESLALAPDGTLYVAGNSKLASSQDGGRNWERLAEVTSSCDSSDHRCSGALFAANDVVLLGDLESRGIFTYNVGSGEISPRSSAGRSVVAGGISSTGFVLGTYGSVWQTPMTSDASANMTRLSKGILVDYSKSGSLCQVMQISGSVAQAKVYALTRNCGEDVRSIYTASLPLLDDWTQIGPTAGTVANLKGIYSHPLSDDIWIFSNAKIARGANGDWKDGVAENVIAIDGYQTSPTESTVIILFENDVGRATNTEVEIEYLFLGVAPEDSLNSALHVSNATTYLIGWYTGTVSSTLDVSLDAGASWNPGSYNFGFPIRAIYYRRNVDVIIVATEKGLWESVGGILNSSRTFVRAQSSQGNVSGAFDSIWARSDDDIYASGEQQEVIWHYTGGLWVAIATPLSARDSWLKSENEHFGVRGIWGTPAGDTYAGTRVGVIASPVDTLSPTRAPTLQPTRAPTSPTGSPTPPTFKPTRSPTGSPTTVSPTSSPTTLSPTPLPTRQPTPHPTRRPTKSPQTEGPTPAPSPNPTLSPSVSPTLSPTSSPSTQPTKAPTLPPSIMECVCLDDCQYKGYDLSNNGVCEDSGPGGNNARDPQQLAACMLGHDCADCGTNNRTGLREPQSCDGKTITKRDAISGAFAHFVLLEFLLPSLALLAL